MTVIKDAGLAAFGERWASEAAFASLIFDYRFFGDSDGHPRNLVSLDKQLQDYRSVIAWARQRPEIFKNDRIVVMASALSGITVSQLAIEDAALAGMMAHCPMLDGEPFFSVILYRISCQDTPRSCPFRSTHGWSSGHSSTITRLAACAHLCCRQTSRVRFDKHAKFISW